MVKRNPGPTGRIGATSMLTESEIEQVENETIEKVSRTISVLESALAKWKVSEKKPEELKEKFARYRRFHDALAQWETDALKARRMKESFDTRVERLRRFVDICYSYA